ncbi:MAG: hypothetical protein AB8H79_25760 [Myxococcota bacterium]
MGAESLFASAAGGWNLIQRDPIGILLPSAASLLLHLGVMTGVQAGWNTLGPWSLVALFCALSAARIVLATPLRGLAIAAGARERGHHFSVVAQTPSLVIVWLVAAAVEGAVIIALMSGAVLPAWWLIARGSYWGAIVLVASAAPALLVLTVIARTAFAYSIIEATVGKRGPYNAIKFGLQRTGRDWFNVLCIELMAELVFGFGALLCGAGALPGLPLADLALLHRWTDPNEEEE